MGNLPFERTRYNPVQDVTGEEAERIGLVSLAVPDEELAAFLRERQKAKAAE